MFSVLGETESTEEPEYDTVPFTVTLPLFVTMTVLTVLELKFPLLTASTLDGDNDMPFWIPVPLRVTVDGLPAALCVIVNVAL